MPRLTIDQREVDVPPGATILDAARKLGIDVPTLCFLDGYPPPTSCLLCTVKIRDTGRLVPSCATAAIDGMQIESETEEVHQVRRCALELLLSDHLGDCLAPCQLACPAHMDIPQMLRQIHAGDFRGAIETVKRDIALPAVLGRVCPAPCEKACRRAAADGAVAICRLKRFAADVDLSAQETYLPTCSPPSGKQVAIVGAGPSGLAAAYYLLQQGHACIVFDQDPSPGGRLRSEFDPQQLPPDVLRADIEPILRLGAELRSDVRISGKDSFDTLRNKFDVVLLSCGASGKEQAESWGLATAPRGIQVDRQTYQTEIENVFAAGNAIRGQGLAVRSVADGKEAAAAIHEYLCGLPPSGPQKPWNTRIGRLEPDELQAFLATAAQAPRRDPAAGPHAGFDVQEATEQAARCLHCDCRGLHSCRLRHYAQRYHADPRRYQAPRRRFQQDNQHPEVIYEPGKCINCGLCIEVAKASGEALGLTFVGRGFDVRLATPLDRPLSEALAKAAAKCAVACPTGALSLRQEIASAKMPIRVA